MGNRKIHIAVVDDNQFFRKGLMMALERVKGVGIISEADSGIEYLDMLHSICPDITFMDIKMPELNGIETTKKAIQFNHQLKIIALTMHKESEYVAQMIMAGARGFLLKEIDDYKLEQAISNVMKGDRYFSDTAITNLNQSKLF